MRLALFNPRGADYVATMRLRRPISLLTCLLLLQLHLGATARLCANAPADDAATAPTSHAHHGGGSPDDSHSDESSDAGHCALMTACTLVLGVAVDARAVVATADDQHEHAHPATQPPSLSTAPDSPPPKS